MNTKKKRKKVDSCFRGVVMEINYNCNVYSYHITILKPKLTLFNDFDNTSIGTTRIHKIYT